MYRNPKETKMDFPYYVQFTPDAVRKHQLDPANPYGTVEWCSRTGHFECDASGMYLWTVVRTDIAAYLTDAEYAAAQAR